MNSLSMAYLGRVVGLGRTEDRRPFVVYGVSGRSEASRQRRAVPYRARVAIEPVGEMTPEQLQRVNLLVYNAIKVSNGRFGEDVSDWVYPYAIVSNGRHTDSLHRVCKNWGSDEPTELRGVLKRFGPEPDRYKTPRIMAISSDTGLRVMGIIAEDDKPRITTFLDDKETWGNAFVLSTYSGRTPEPEAPTFRRAREIIRKIPLEGNAPEELSGSLFNWMDPEFVVSTAAAVWYNEEVKWVLAVKNIHQ